MHGIRESRLIDSSVVLQALGRPAARLEYVEMRSKMPSRHLDVHLVLRREAPHSIGWRVLCVQRVNKVTTRIRINRALIRAGETKERKEAI